MTRPYINPLGFISSPNSSGATITLTNPKDSKDLEPGTPVTVHRQTQDHPDLHRTQGKITRIGYTTAIFAITRQDPCPDSHHPEDILTERTPVYLALKDSFEPDPSRMLTQEQADSIAKRAQRRAEIRRSLLPSERDTAITQAHQKALDGLVKCAGCNASMNHTDGHLVCTGNGDRTGQPCPAENVDADMLIRSVMAGLISTVNDEPTIQGMVTTIKDKTGSMAQAARANLEETELALMDLKERSRAVRSEGQKGHEADLERIAQETKHLARQALAYRDELECCNFLANEQAIRDNMAHLDTFIGPEDTAELFSLLIQDVTVSSDHALITYHADPQANNPGPQRITLH